MTPSSSRNRGVPEKIHANGYAPFGTAARKIHDRDVVQGNVVQQLVSTKVQAQILGAGRTHAAICIRFDRTRATTDPGAACTVVWWYWTEVSPHALITPQPLLYSSWRRHQGPVSLRPFGARSSHWNMPQRPSTPRA